MQARKLNDHGLREFEKFVVGLKSDNEQNTPIYLLHASESSEKLDVEVEVKDGLQFESRFAMGTYLVDLLNDQDIQKFLGETGFWSWFALLWFDQLCPLNSDDKRKPSMPYNYILSKKYNHRPRHAIFMTWQLVSFYGEDVRFLLSKPPSTRGELVEQLMARQDFYTSRGAVLLANKLYSDPATYGFKRGAAGRGSGSVVRFISVLQQLQTTYDIFSISMVELDSLYPAEFNRFR